MRSDYTNQFVRFRRHATRIDVMYAFIFPLLSVLAVWVVYDLAYYAGTGTVP